MTDTKYTAFGVKGSLAVVADYGEAEYLDGVLMQYAVANSAGVHPGYRSFAYFGTEEDAVLFAKAKARQLKKERATGHSAPQMGVKSDLQ